MHTRVKNPALYEYVYMEHVYAYHEPRAIDNVMYHTCAYELPIYDAYAYTICIYETCIHMWIHPRYVQYTYACVL